ncbi:MAG: hypothetical protein GXZ07_04580 [Firmicutes bacterium]|nr:hypothetical protein [Bacillota bacterium]
MHAHIVFFIRAVRLMGSGRVETAFIMELFQREQKECLLEVIASRNNPAGLFNRAGRQ